MHDQRTALQPAVRNVCASASTLVALRAVALVVLSACDDAPCAAGFVRVADSCVQRPDAMIDDAGPDAPPDAMSDVDPILITVADETGPEPLPACASEMVGTYALRDTVFTQGAPFDVTEMLTTVNYDRVTIVERAGRLEFTIELCEAVLIDSSGRPSSVPTQNHGYLAPPLVAPMDLDCDAMTWKVVPDRIVVGFTPGMPEGCRNGETTASNNWLTTCRCPPAARADEVPLPNDADDCRVDDVENDLKPGVTVVNQWGDLRAETYVVLDHEGFAAGEIAADGRHRGAWHDRGSESIILGCDDSFVLGCPKPNLVPCTGEVNEMIFVPIADSTTCGGVLASRDTLFDTFPIATPPETSECF